MGIKQRVYPEPGQAAIMISHCGQARFVYNLALEQRSYWKPWRRVFDQKVTTATQMRELTELRAAVDWLRAGSTVVQQGALRDLDRAFTNFFNGTGRYPKFKKKTGKQSFVIRDLSVRRLSKRRAEVQVPKVGWIAFVPTRPWAEIKAATSARMSRDPSGRWHVSFTTTPGEFARDTTLREVGIDRGGVNSIATSHGDLGSAPTLTPGEQKRYVALQQRLARQDTAAKARQAAAQAQARKAAKASEATAQQTADLVREAGQAARYSARREQTRLSLARLNATLKDRRTDWIEQTTTALVRQHDLVAIEILPTAAMTRKPKPKPDPDQPGQFLPNGARAKAGLNKVILASCWGKFETRLRNKAVRSPASAPCTITPVPARNTSRTCAACGYVAGENRESQAVFTCHACGHTAHADTNAAINILARAHTLHAQPGAEPLTQPADGGGSDASVTSTDVPRQPNTCAA